MGGTCPSTPTRPEPSYRRYGNNLTKGQQHIAEIRNSWEIKKAKPSLNSEEFSGIAGQLTTGANKDSSPLYLCEITKALGLALDAHKPPVTERVPIFRESTLVNPICLSR
jgi:hypothetical protein